MIEGKLRQYFLEEINKASIRLSIDISEPQSNALISYIELLIKWNQAYNLTAIREPEEMFIKHLLDSLSIAPYIKGSRILDVGTGPGLPGIPLAIVYPEKNFVLLDSNGKKTRFLVQAKMSLKLPNIEIINKRVELVKDATGFDQIVSRAFTALDNMVNLCKHLLTPSGQFLAMKGLVPEKELAIVGSAHRVIPLSVPGCMEQRNLIILENS